MKSKAAPAFVNPVISFTKSTNLARLLLNWFSENARDLPWRKTHDPYAIWISEIMLQQTQVKTVISYWNRWMRDLPTIQSLAKAKSKKLLKLWEGLGYYTRVCNLQKTAQTVCEKHDGKFPDNFDEILSLPGIGRYTAGAICSIAFNQPKPILDGNVIRVLTRVFGISGKPREKKTNDYLWEVAKQLVNHASYIKRPSSCSHLNQSLMELGALICTPRQPKCLECPAMKLCIAYRENRVAELPNLEKRVKATKRYFVAFIVENNGRFLVAQRPAKIVNARLWEFPNVERADGKIDGSLSPFFVPEKAAPICTIQHSITRYRITLEAFGATLLNQENTIRGKWLRVSELQKLAFPSAHRQILEHLTARKCRN